ncbi:glyoxalase [Sphaerisporangium krabiense]|uniref:Catechol 2,3-dioxygenase-like lactoylglutathione lyase family enzyme n=1 Tax=Sphaerisporangium krabiense TaxID=763782 RepID=A0A7W8ZBE2_9ACTN|nr:VOC family protein [Sphaerisporangium krabiense]MBB5630800.1 catechol 2,3-dioxygenase-like lactoylglutathione lyase family enzyme [Sphaerisporangium krabiense]GII65517.1 glyoxalase [Sphaerisporangium krabiense]
MDALYPRVLAGDFAGCFRFYDGLLGKVAGGTLVKGDPSGPYANWDLGGEALLALLDRSMMDGVTPLAPSGPCDAVMLVLKVEDVGAAAAVAREHGGRLVAPPVARPQWGPTVRTAHLRDPDGNLVELQSY